MANFVTNKLFGQNGEKNAKTDGKPLYEVCCTECGHKLQSRFFSLDNLLKHYSNGRPDEKAKGDFIRLMGIGTYYGELVLPAAPALLKDGKLQVPQFFDRGTVPPCVQCERSSIPMDKLVPMDLHVGAIVAQFVRMSGFHDIYKMLQIQIFKNEAQDMGENLDNALKLQFQELCTRLIGLRGIRIGEMGQVETRNQTIEKALDWVLQSAQREEELREKEPDKMNFSTERISALWRYEVVNDRKMPAALLLRGSNDTVYFNSDCCCGLCRRQIPRDLGAYEQRIIGLLGTQSTGKTTYLSALADAIDWGELTRSTAEDNSETRMTIRACMDGDQNWQRAKAEPPTGGSTADRNAKAGMLWLYQHGFPPEKTEVGNQDASALTFLVNSKKENQEPVMYTLADIPGEAFQDVVLKKYDANFLDRQHQLLRSCHALMVVVSTRQMDQDESHMGSELLNSPGAVLNCCRSFLPRRQLPAAVVMTASDEINGGNLRQPLHLAYDLKRTHSLILSKKKGCAVYNAELMHTSVQAVNDFINIHFGNFVSNLRGIIREQQDSGTEVKVASFAVSSGTQKAPYYYLDDVDPDYEFQLARPDWTEDQSDEERKQCAFDAYHDPEEEKARSNSMRRARFGICTPLQWLLACDGILDLDFRDEALDTFPESVREGARKRIEKSLYL